MAAKKWIWKSKKFKLIQENAVNCGRKLLIKKNGLHLFELAGRGKRNSVEECTTDYSHS